MAPKSPASPEPGSGQDGSPTADSYAAMSVKKLTQALEDREERFVEETKAIRKLEAETVQAESKAFRSEEEQDAASMEVDKQASQESVLASEAQRLAKELRELSKNREEIEARHSYGAYWRWRQRLHSHLGCSQDEADKGLEWLLPRGTGSMPSSEAKKVMDEAKQWKQRVEDMKTALASSEQKAFELRRGRDNAELEWMRLGLDLTEQKQWASEWWEWHLAQMPEYTQQHQQIVSLEARSSELARELQQAHLQLEEFETHEYAAYQTVVAAQSEFSESEGREMEVSREALEASEESAALRRKVVPGGIPGDEDGIPLVRTWKQRLLKATQEAEKLEREGHEAKQEEKELLTLAKQRERDIAEIEQRIRRVEKNADLLALRYKEQTRRLQERDREHLRLVKASRDVAIEMERNRSILSSWGALRERRDSAGAGPVDIHEIQPAGRERSREPSPRPSDSASREHQTRDANVDDPSGQKQNQGGSEPGKVSRSRSESRSSHKPTPSSGEEVQRNGTARSFNPDRWIPAGPNVETARSQSASRSHGSQSVNGNGSPNKVMPHREGAVSAEGSAVGRGHLQEDAQKLLKRASRIASPSPSPQDSGSPVFGGYVGEIAPSAPKPMPLKKRPL